MRIFRPSFAQHAGETMKQETLALLTIAEKNLIINYKQISKKGGFMMKQAVLVAVVVLIMVVPSFSYDTDTAKKFDAMFSQMTPEAIAKRPCEVNAKQLFEMLRKKEEFVVLDVRTPQEMDVIGITLKNTLRIPMHELFRAENLKKLPSDKKIVVICHTGTRSVAATTALRAAGFVNAYTFKGGTIELAAESGRSIVGSLW